MHHSRIPGGFGGQASERIAQGDQALGQVGGVAGSAGVGIASLYRRYRSKDELFQHLCALSLGQWIQAAEHGLQQDDPW